MATGSKHMRATTLRGAVMTGAALTMTTLTMTTLGTAALGAAAPQSAENTLTTAIAAMRGLGYNITGTSGTTAAGGSGSLTGTGSVDPSTKSAGVEFKGTEGGTPVDVNLIQIDDTFFAKLDIKAVQSQLGVDPNTWLLVNEAKLNTPPNLPFDVSGSSDALDLDGLFTSVSGVAYPDPSDPTHITGTVDLTAATGVSAPDSQELNDAGAAAKTTPFTVTLDGQGRITNLKVDADAYDGDLTEDITFSDFGSPNPVTAPPANEVVPAPQSAYQFFND